MKESFKTTTMTSLGFIGPLKNLASPTNLIFCADFRPPAPPPFPLHFFWSEISKSRGDCYHGTALQTQRFLIQGLLLSLVKQVPVYC